MSAYCRRQRFRAQSGVAGQIATDRPGIGRTASNRLENGGAFVVQQGGLAADRAEGRPQKPYGFQQNSVHNRIAHDLETKNYLKEFQQEP